MLSRNTIFAHPKRASAILGTSSVFIMLIPTCMELVPLSNSRKTAKSERDDAYDNYVTTLQELKDINAKIDNRKQRILDLDCAMQGSPQFNRDISHFQERIDNSSATPAERLNLFWQIKFIPDQTTPETYVIQKSWEEWEYQYDYYFSCIDHSCGKDSSGKKRSCCWGWDWHWVKEKYYYDETVTIQNIYKNIITGSPLEPFSLDCGYYSRKFQTFSPENYQALESEHIFSGDRKSGAALVTFNKEFASRIKLSYLLDEVNTESVINVLSNVVLGEAAFDLSEKLEQFLTYAVAAFKVAGANYMALQDGFREEIPTLYDAADAINSTLQQQGKILADKQSLFDGADENYNNGLEFWLPLFFLIPGGIALISYLLITYGKRFFSTSDDSVVARNNDIELGLPKTQAVVDGEKIESNEDKSESRPRCA